MKSIWKIKMVGLVLAALSAVDVMALVPVEGLLHGEANLDHQEDPLQSVFQLPQDGQDVDRLRHRLYMANLQASEDLKNSCDHLSKTDYASAQSQTIARRSIVANLQYIGLDRAVKAIGAYASTLQMPADEFATLSTNLVNGSCSTNISVYGIKLLKSALKNAFEKEKELPTLPGMPYAPLALKEKTDSRAAKEAEFHYTLKVFRSLCSWGGDVNDYRLLPPFLKSPLVMSWVIRFMEGKEFSYSELTRSVEAFTLPTSSRVACQELICRAVNPATFQSRFPLSLGSTGLKQDLQRQWCHHFRYLDYSNKVDNAMVKSWIKYQSPEAERKEVGQLWALVTGIPELSIPLKRYDELQTDLRVSIDERWGVWSKKSLSRFSRGLLYEEPLEISINPRQDVRALRRDLFAFDLSVTMGELDRLLSEKDKLSLSMSFSLHRSWLRWVRLRWTELNQQPDPAVRDAFVEKVAEHLKIQVEAKRRYFPTPLFGEGLEYLLAQEIISQLSLYDGPFFDTMADKVVEVPLRMRYGMFALSYVRYRALLKAKEKTIDL